MVLVPSPKTLVSTTVVVITLWTFPATKGSTTLYQCMNAEGTTVFTDSPAQLTHCVALDPETLAPKVEAPQNVTPMAREHQRPYPRTPQQPVLPDPRDDPAPASFEQEENSEMPPTDQAAPATLPLTKIGNAMLVQVLLNREHHAHLIVDTGASMTVLSYDLAIELGILSGAGVNLDTVNTAGGSVQVNMTHVKEIRAGSAIARNVPVAIHDLPNPIPGVSGLLGMSFLNHFKVTLDAEQKTLHLTPRK